MKLLSRRDSATFAVWTLHRPVTSRSSSLGGVPLACAGDDAGSGSGSATTSTTTADVTSGGTATGGETSSATTTDGASDGSSGTTGATTSTSFLTTNSTGETTDPTGGGGIGCEGWASKYVECYPRGSYDELLAYCEAFVDEYSAMYGAECEAAVQGLLDCYASSTCAELESGETCLSAYYTFYELCSAEPEEGCLAYEVKYIECLGDMGENPAEYCQVSINGGLAEYGEACGQAHEDLFACLTALDCADFESREACAEQKTAIDEACV